MSQVWGRWSLKQSKYDGLVDAKCTAVYVHGSLSLISKAIGSVSRCSRLPPPPPPPLVHWLMQARRSSRATSDDDDDSAGGDTPIIPACRHLGRGVAANGGGGGGGDDYGEACEHRLAEKRGGSLACRS